jgi:hypothetical protein
MKKQFISLLGLLFLLSGVAYAQDEIKEIQKEWGKDKKELVGMAMDLSSADAAKFWPLYDKYEKERQKLGRERLRIYADYADNLESLTNAKTDEIITRLFKNDAALTKLHQQYYTSIKTKLNAKQAAKFIQIESYFNIAIRSAVQDELPYIGELDSMKSKQ